MKSKKIALGPGASSMILVVIVLALCILVMLTTISARNDDSLSLRASQTMVQTHELISRGEESLASLDAVLASCRARATGEEEYLALVEEALPENMTLEEDQVFWEEVTEKRMLECGVRLLPAEADGRTEWTVHRISAAGGEDEWEDDWD